MTYVRQTRMARNKRIIIYSVAAAILIFMCVAIFIVSKEDENMPVEEGITNIKVQNTINVVRAIRNIQTGEVADITKFEVVAVPKGLVPDGAASNIMQLENKIVTRQISTKEFLMETDLAEDSMWFEEEDRLTEHAFQGGAVPTTISIGSIVDIKLFRPKAEDCVVVSKTVVIGKEENTLSFYLNEAEQENIKEANTEGLLFIVQYLDKSQPASVTNYKPAYRKEGSNIKVRTDTVFANSDMKNE